MKYVNKISGLGIITAIAASLCCITPILAAIAGISGLATTFSWLEPARPYFIGATVLVLGVAWYQKRRIKEDQAVDCDCDTEPKLSFWQSKRFLGIVTVVAALLLAFPNYSFIFFPQVDNATIVSTQDKINKVEIVIEGMTCTGCEQHIKSEVAKQNGIVNLDVSYEEGIAYVKYIDGHTSVDLITKAINSTGYEVVKVNEIFNTSINE